MSTSPRPPAVGRLLWNLLKTLFLGWILFNVLLYIAGWFLVRFYNIDEWPYRVSLANWLTYDRFINPQDLVPPNMTFDRIQLMDTDGDDEMERVVIYRYDLVTGRSPVGASVYDYNGCRPRGIDHYELLPVDRDYLSDGPSTLQVLDIPDVGAGAELLVWGRDRTDLSIFQWVDDTVPCQPAQPGERGYVNLGTFRGSGGVRIEGSRIIVKDQAFERSQLATTRVYTPQGGTYRTGLGNSMGSPVARAVDFTFSPPTPVPATFYPEKAVLAFYLAIGQNTPEAAALLDPGAVVQYIQGNLGREVAEPGALTTMAEVREIAYLPNLVEERRHGDIPVEVEVVNRRPDGSLSPPHRYRVWVRGFPRVGAYPYDCEWRIFRFEPLG